MRERYCQVGLRRLRASSRWQASLLDRPVLSADDSSERGRQLLDWLRRKATACCGVAIADRDVYQSSISRFRDAGIVLPTFAELTDPETIPSSVSERLEAIDPQQADALNLFRVYWNNTPDGGRVEVPQYLELPSTLTGVRARIVLLLGDSFPMIQAHKVLAAQKRSSTGRPGWHWPRDCAGSWW